MIEDRRTLSVAEPDAGISHEPDVACTARWCRLCHQGRLVVRRLSYRDALKILAAGNSSTLGAVDAALGGLILGATAITGSIGLLGLLDGRSEIIKQVDKLISRIGQRMRGATGRDRTDLLVAAQVVIAISAFFEALPEAASQNAALADQLRLAGNLDGEGSNSLVGALLETDVPTARPELAFEDHVGLLRAFYAQMSDNFVQFLNGLALWDQFNETERARFIRKFHEVPERAVRRYEESFRQLCVDCPDLLVWTLLRENAATRIEIRNTLGRLAGNSEDVALIGFSGLLKHLYGTLASTDWPERIANAYRPQLDRPIAESMLAELHIPSLGEAYINPRCRIAAVTPDSRPAEDSWWENQNPYEDIQWLLAGLFTAPGASEAPIVVLGQPGSGKSVLTKVLTATLPPSQYLPVRVELRRVQADAPLQEQVESAIFDATGTRMSWRDLVDKANNVRPVILLDGFDELLQSTQVSQSDYLDKIQQFQRRESDYGRPVTILVTSRTVVADRMRYPEGAVALRLDPFTPSQISSWLDIWNEANASYFTRTGLRPLRPEEVLEHADLAVQPLLLLMLALYDADGNQLPRNSELIDQADLYERLLRRFAHREVTKLHPNMDEAQTDAEVTRELTRLSVIAFSMFNRGRQVAFEEEIDEDLAGLLNEGTISGLTDQFKTQLPAAQLVVGRFFFIHESQATLDSGRRRSYEFLHATFGEYLVARMVRNLLSDLVATAKARASSVFGPSGQDDSLLHTLLCWTPLTDRRQICTFLVSLLKSADVDLRGCLLQLFSTVNETRLPDAYERYSPVNHNAPNRHAIYAANLLLLIMAASGPVRASDLFALRGWVDWRDQALLWRATLTPESFGGLVDALHVERIRMPKDLRVSLAMVGETWEPATLDLQWSLTPDEPQNRDQADGFWTSWAGDDLYRHGIFLTDPDIDILLHSVEPFLRKFPTTVSTAHAISSEMQTPAHAIMMLDFEADTRESRIMQYRSSLQAVRLIDQPEPQGRLLLSVLKRLRSDASGLGEEAVFEVLLDAHRDIAISPEARVVCACVFADLMLRSERPNETWRLDKSLRGELTKPSVLGHLARSEPFLALEIIRFSSDTDQESFIHVLNSLPDAVLARLEPPDFKQLMVGMSRGDSARLRRRWEAGRIDRRPRAGS
jgi:hypothetical protein